MTWVESIVLIVLACAYAAVAVAAWKRSRRLDKLAVMDWADEVRLRRQQKRAAP